MRTRNHASAILAELDKHRQDDVNCRYQAIKFTPLAETPLIQDLVSLTLALSQPADRLAWLALLRAPFIGLDLADLDVMVSGNAGNSSGDAICECAEEPHAASLTSNGQQRLQRVSPVLEQALERRGRQSMRNQLAST